MKKKIALFFGGRSLESDISVITALQTLGAIDKSAYEAEPVYMYGGKMYVGGVNKISAFSPFNEGEHTVVHLVSGGLYEVKRGKLKRRFVPDVALICCHGGEGEGGVLQSMLEYNGIRYTSCSPLASALLLDKLASKRMFESLLFNVLPYRDATHKDYIENGSAVIDSLEELEYPIIVKPARLGSSIGIRAAHNREELEYALDIAFSFDKEVVAEHMLTDFIEVNCAAYRDGEDIVVSETERPISCGDFLSFEDKYMANGKMGGGEHRIPAGIGPAELIVKAATERVYKELCLDGVIRADFLVDGDSKVYLNEINTVPGSLATYLFRDISHTDMLSALIRNASLKQPSAPASFKTDVLSRFSGGGKLAK